MCGGEGGWLEGYATSGTEHGDLPPRGDVVVGGEHGREGLAEFLKLCSFLQRETTRDTQRQIASHCVYNGAPLHYWARRKCPD